MLIFQIWWLLLGCAGGSTMFLLLCETKVWAGWVLVFILKVNRKDLIWHLSAFAVVGHL